MVEPGHSETTGGPILARVTGRPEHGLLGWGRRLAPLVAPLWILAWGLATPMPHPQSLAWVALAGMALATGGELLRAWKRTRIAEVRLGPGFVEVGGRRGVADKIVGRRLRGATTAGIRNAQGRGQVVTVAGDHHTVSLEVSTSEEATRLRKALAIGHNGFGRVPLHRPQAALGIFAAVFMCLAFGGANRLADYLILWSGWMACLLWRAARGTIGTPAVVLQSWGVEAKGALTRYEHIAEIVRGPKLIELKLINGARVWVGDGASTEELRVLEAQIKEARKRALGYGTPTPQVDQAIARLGEGDEGASAWLQALDAQSQRLLSAAGYRGGGGVTEEELWATLESHDASPDVRAAVARVLSRASKLPDAKARIDRAARSSREEHTEKLIRVAVDDDTEEAAAELEALQVQEARRRAGA